MSESKRDLPFGCSGGVDDAGISLGDSAGGSVVPEPTAYNK